MYFEIDDEFLKIVEIIKNENKTFKDWEKEESSDDFQSDHFQGGFDLIEGAFCFSYFDDYRNEYWFQFKLDEIDNILNGSIKKISLRSPE